MVQDGLDMQRGGTLNLLLWVAEVETARQEDQRQCKEEINENIKSVDVRRDNAEDSEVVMVAEIQVPEFNLQVLVEQFSCCCDYFCLDALIFHPFLFVF